MPYSPLPVEPRITEMSDAEKATQKEVRKILNAPGVRLPEHACAVRRAVRALEKSQSRVASNEALASNLP